MCCFSGFLLVGLLVGTVSNLKNKLCTNGSNFALLFFYGGIKTTQVKKAIAKSRHSTHIYRTTHKDL